IAATLPRSQPRAIRPAFASAGVGALRIRSMISSMFARASARPSRMCARSRALRNSKIVRRVTTSRR
ncbi:hypothetical protein D044_2462B, partial [Vibrio parahaemolyticus EKP-026]